MPVRAAGSRRCVLLVLVLAGAIASPPLRAAVLFADGFEPCCAIGGTVHGLTGQGLVLRLTTGMLAEDLAITPSGPLQGYRFASRVADGAHFLVSVAQLPAGQQCSLARADGMASGPVLDVDVHCGAAGALLWDLGTWDGDAWN